MSRFLVWAFLLCSAAAQAYSCVPSHLGGTGTYYTETKTPDGISRMWVCVDALGKPSYSHLTNLYSFVPSPACAVATAALSVVSAAAAPAAASAAMAQCAGVQAADKARYDALQAAGLAAVKAKWDADHPTSALVWRTPASGTLTLYTYSAGKLGSPIFGRKAPPNALCNCSVAKAMSGTSTYCALDAGAANEVTYCQQR